MIIGFIVCLETFKGDVSVGFDRGVEGGEVLSVSLSSSGVDGWAVLLRVGLCGGFVKVNVI